MHSSLFCYLFFLFLLYQTIKFFEVISTESLRQFQFHVNKSKTTIIRNSRRMNYPIGFSILILIANLRSNAWTKTNPSIIIQSQFRGSLARLRSLTSSSLGSSSSCSLHNFFYYNLALASQCFLRTVCLLMTAYTGWPATLLKVNTSTSEFSRFTIVQTLTIRAMHQI